MIAERSDRGRRFLRGLTLLSAALLAAGALSVGGPPGPGFSQSLVRTAAVIAGIALGAACLLPVEWNARVLLLFLSICATLLAGEVVLRLFFAPRYVAIYRMDPTYLYALKPGATKVFTHLKINGGRSILVRTNSRGFRGEELLPAGAARRVVVYGDSLIEAEFSALEDTFAKRLERDLAGRLRKPVEVINAGVVGYGPDQVSLRMRAEIADLRPDLVIVSLFADNDFGDLIRNKIYRLSADHELEEGDPLVSQDLKDGFERAETGSMLFRLISKAFSHADAWWVDPLDGIDPGSREFARMEIWLDGCREDYEDYVRRGTVVTNLLEDFYDADVSLTPRSRSARLKAELMDRVVLKLKMTAEAARVPLLILIVPSAHDAVPNYDYGRVDRVKFPEYRPEGMTDLLQGMARRHAIPFVNFFGPFMERGAGDLYFRGGEDHWNDRGQEVAASLVADEIVSSGWLR